MPSTAHHPAQSRLTPLVGHALAARVRGRARKLGDLEYWRRSTAALQLDQLRWLLERAADTEFGRAHRFGRLARLERTEMLRAYRAEVPLADWYAFQDALTRMRDHAESNVLWPGRVLDFAQSSGTTAGDKHLPVSRALLRSNYLASVDLFATMMRFGADLAQLCRGQLLLLGGSTALEKNEHGVRTGDLSGIAVNLIRWPLTTVYQPGRDVALMEHWPSKIDRIVENCLRRDIRMISGVPSWMNILFERLVARAQSEGMQAACVRDIWPNLTVLVHGGVRYDPFEARMRQHLSGDSQKEGVPHRVEVYPASEGFVAIQDRPGEGSLRLLSDIRIFYEFIPVEDVGQPDARAFTVDRVEKGQRYAVAMTTCGGLWRYLLGDVVEFDSVPAHLDGRGGDGSARLRIVGRQGHFINAFGEHVIVENVETAVTEASRELKTLIGEFTCAPEYPEHGRSGRLELAIELEGDSALLARFGELFDAGLKRVNKDYATKRDGDVGMGPPRITPVPTGTFHRWMDSRGKLGGQHKCPRCANKREYIDGVLRASADMPTMPSVGTPRQEDA